MDTTASATGCLARARSRYSKAVGRLGRLLSACSIVFLLLAPAAQAGEAMRFALYQPCPGSASVCGTRILAAGEIVASTPRDFLEFVARNKIAGEMTVCFHSPGGSLAGGLGLGRAIRKLRFDTCLEREYSEETVRDGLRTLVSEAACASACTFAFLGGVKRDVDDVVRFGVHQFSGADGNVGDGATQVTVVQLALYLEEMGVDRRLLDVASLVPPDEIRFLEVPVLVRLRVTNTRARGAEWSLAASENGTAYAMLRQEYEDKPAHLVAIVQRTAAGPVLQIGFRLTRMRMTPREVKTALDGAPFELRASGRTLARIDRPAWQLLEHNTFALRMPLTQGSVAQLLRSPSVELHAEVPKFLRDLDPSIQISTQGLARNVSAALR